VNNVIGDLRRFGAGAEASVEADRAGDSVIEPRSAGDLDQMGVRSFVLFQQREKFLEALEVLILLGHDLGDEDRIGLEFGRPADQIFMRDLRSKIGHLKDRIRFEPFIAGNSFHRKDRVDSDCMRIRSGRTADNDDRTTDLLGQTEKLLMRKLRMLRLRDMDAGHVDIMRRVAIGDEERELVTHRLHARDLDSLQPEFLEIKTGRLLRLGPYRERKGEGDLHSAVAEMVTVRPDSMKVLFHVDVLCSGAFGPVALPLWVGRKRQKVDLLFSFLKTS